MELQLPLFCELVIYKEKLNCLNKKYNLCLSLFYKQKINSIQRYFKNDAILLSIYLL